MPDSMACVAVSVSRGHAERSEKASQAAHPNLIITCGQSARVDDDPYARGPLGRPPWPSTGWMRDASRMESSLGPGSGVVGKASNG